MVQLPQDLGPYNPVKKDKRKASTRWFNFHGTYLDEEVVESEGSYHIQPPKSKEMHGTYLDEEVTELRDWIKSFKKQ